MESFEELQFKYNKLASEYSKLRSQVPVLKKAFTEEQSKNNSLCEELKSKDQLLRIAESEADSLNFRNQQLLCRVTVLQEELESIQNCSKKDHKSKNYDGPQFLHNFDEELSKKVAENATLIFTLIEYKERHESEVKALKDEIESLKLNAFDNEQPIKTNEVSPEISSAQKNSISETIEKALEKQLYETQQSLQATIAERDRLKQKLKQCEENLKISDFESDLSLNESYVSLPEDNGFDASEDPLNKEAVTREKAIKKCYRIKNEKLIAEKVTLKSKVDSFEEECLSLKSRLENEAVVKKALQDSLEKEKENCSMVKEELNTTAENYEIQLSTMSDHLAGLNDIIEEQKGQLDFFQIELQKHSNCKVKK